MKRIEPHGFAAPGKKARRYGGLAAAFVCVVGLAALLSVMGRMGASKGGNMAPADDMAMWEETQEKGESVHSSSSGVDDAADEVADIPAEEPADLEESVDFAGEPAAPGWQEQLLAESKRADELISWHLTAVYDGISFVLESELVENAANADHTVRTVSASLIYEVYYKEGTGEWVRVYRTNRSMSQCEPRTVWGDEYSMSELNMTRPGTYRVVRQVNSYRQVLELTMSKWE